MAPVKPKGGARLARKSATSKPSKSQKVAKRPPSKQVKTKPISATTTSKPKKKATPVYTDAQLNLPAMNSIIPASATAAQRSGKGTGKKKNKVYVDDQESMMTILALVNAEKEGAIESKMMRERQMEEIREARRKETEKRAEQKKGKFEEVKKGLKTKNKFTKPEDSKTTSDKTKDKAGERKKRKSVSFA